MTWFEQNAEFVNSEEPLW